MQRFGTLIVGIILLAAGAFMFIRNNNLVKNCTVEAEATVVDMKQELSVDSDTTTYMYTPIIEYRVGEDTVKSQMDSSSNTPAYSINEKLTILYNPNKPSEFIIKDDKITPIISIVFMVIGAIVTGYGTFIAVKNN